MTDQERFVSRFRAARTSTRAAACNDCKRTQVFAKWGWPTLPRNERRRERRARAS